MKTEGIILAAGQSSRAGTNKLLLKIQNLTIIERAILSMYDHCSRIIVVGGHRISDIYWIKNLYPKVDLIYNQDHLSGMFSSVKKGLKALEGDRFFLIPGDYPMINKSTYEEILRIHSDIVVPRYKGKRGHPVLIKSNLRDEILNDKSLVSLRDYIRKKGSTTIEVADPNILLDIDTLEDYRKIL